MIKKTNSKLYVFLILSILVLLVLVVGNIALAATETSDPTSNLIILPADGKVTLSIVDVNPSTACNGDFGVYQPINEEIFSDYLYFYSLPYTLPDTYTAGTEFVFMLNPHGFCSGVTYLSTDPSHAIVTHPDEYTWIIYWEDWTDADFDDVTIEVSLEPGFAPFLDLPYDYSDSTFAKETRDTELGGKLNAYFDHQYPTYCSTPNTGGCSASDVKAVNFYGYDGGDTENNQPPYNVVYNGHDGNDFLEPTGTPLLAAAAGEVTFRGEIETTCSDKVVRKANVIKITHDNGYVTEYWHLSAFAGDIVLGSDVERDTAKPIGYIGSTGCVTGAHLHFLVRNPEGIKVDPFGWQPKPDAAWWDRDDPWQTHNADEDNGGRDATSHYLWIHPLQEATLIDPDNVTTVSSIDSDINAIFPTGVHSDPLRVEFAESIQSTIIDGYFVQRNFSLYGYSTNGDPAFVIDNNYTLQITPDNAARYHVPSDSESWVVFVWNSDQGGWESLPTSWDFENGNVVATTNRLGTFAVGVETTDVFLPVVMTQ